MVIVHMVVVLDKTRLVFGVKCSAHAHERPEFRRNTAMARYDYHCPSCDLTFEVEHPMSEHPDVACPNCGAPASQVFGASGIVFRGSGFYNTDQRKGTTSATTATSAASKSEDSGTK